MVNEILSFKLDKSNLLAFEQAKENGYVKQKGNKWRLYTRAYFHWCVFKNRLFILVTEEKHYSKIRFEPINGIPQSLREYIMKTVIKYAKPNEFFGIDAIEHIPNSEVNEVLSDIMKNVNSGILDVHNIENELNKLSLNELRKKALTASPQPDKLRLETQAFNRNLYVAVYAKKRANGLCQLCNLRAPFTDSNGEPYLETHHITWLSKGGEDTIGNTVALCPNCHRKMHILNLQEDVICLTQVAKASLPK